MRKLIVVWLVLAFCLPSFAFKGGQSSSQSSSKRSGSSKSVYVRGYYRKDGTYVAPYYRSAPGTATYSSGSTGKTGIRYYPDYIAPGHAPHSTVRLDSHGKIKRSKSARSAFMRQHPCPTTGKTSGSCPGYVVDHVEALACGGPDDPSNMQWQTRAEAKAKDKTELWCK